MTSKELDMDPAAGLMLQIQELIAPPVSEEAAKAKRKEPKELHAYYKRPGKGHNHDCCDACSEGGDLLCCDKCPASFHLQCHDPPLEEADLPTGEWLCHGCKMAAAGHEAPPPLTGSIADGPAFESEDARTLGLLTRAAAAMNPTQFALPSNLQLPIYFPGTDKGATWRTRGRGRGRRGGEGGGTEEAVPARGCHECGRSCRAAPLLACDFCPLVFHLDCLDPPLPAMPTTRWMCPAHPNHFIDSALVSSSRATERVRLWDAFAGAVDQHAVKVAFFRRCHRRHPPFATRRLLQRRDSVQVPDAVKLQYRERPALLPSLRDLLRDQTLRERLQPANTPEPAPVSTPPPAQGASASEQDAWLNALVALQTSVALRQASAIDKAQTGHAMNGQHNGPGRPNGQLNGQLEQPWLESKLESKLKAGLGLLARGKLEAAEMESPDNGECLRWLDPRLVLVLARQRLQQLQASAIPAPSVPSPPAASPAAGTHSANGTTGTSGAAKTPLSTPKSWRAQLCPVWGGGAGVAMETRALTIGTGADMDVTLGTFGGCNFVSPRHATIFFDQPTQHFELLNYSEFGTTVDNVLYSCDFSGGPAPAAPAADGDEAETEGEAATVAAIRRLVDQRRGRLAPPPAPPPPRQHVDAKVPGAGGCSCRGPAPALGAGWEGTALVSHGSLVKFGCLSFVFAVTDSAPAAAAAAAPASS